MNDPVPPGEPEPTPEQIARAWRNAPYPRRFFTGADVQDMFRALEAEKASNPAFGPADLKPFLDRYRRTRPGRFQLADGSVLTFMPEEPA